MNDRLLFIAACSGTSPRACPVTRYSGHSGREKEGALYVSWVMLVVGSLIAGVALVTLMVVPRRAIPLVLLALIGALVSSMAGLFAIGLEVGRLEISAVTALLGFLLLSLAYTVGTLLLPRVLRSDDSLELPVSADTRQGARVVVTVCAEPERYSPRRFAAALEDLDQTGVPLPSWSARPMLFAAERARYHAAASLSPARRSSAEIVEALGVALADDERVSGVEVAWCEGRSGLPDAMAAAIERGDETLLVTPLAIAESLRADRARSMVDAMRPEEQGLTVVSAPPLWGSATIAKLIVERTVKAMTTRERHTVGICLVGHGQPEAWEDDHPAWTEQETYFHQRIRAHLLDEGVPSEQVRLAWLDWTEPDVTDVLRHLAALGCQLLLVVPASMPVPTLGTLVDLQQAAHFARIPDSTSVVVLEPWGDDPAVVEELARTVRKQLDEAAR